MSTSADRDLLFGLLALQNDFITRDALVAAFGAWVADRTIPLARRLADRGDLNPSMASGLEILVDLHIVRHGGSPEKSLAAISSIDPVALTMLTRVADTDVLASLGHVPPPRDADSPDDGKTRFHSADDPGIPPATVRYKRLRAHAKGGLGEVFVARDRELPRDVALKEIQDEHADNTHSRARFLVEAEITGALEHPGIVPVYGLGAYSDGRPFYAMRFIKGDSLADGDQAEFHASNRDVARKTSYALQKLVQAVLGRLQCRGLRPQPGCAPSRPQARRTSWSANMARPWSSTGAWPRPSARTTSLDGAEART